MCDESVAVRGPFVRRRPYRVLHTQDVAFPTSKQEASEIVCEKCGRKPPEVGFYETAMMRLAEFFARKEETFPTICSECFKRAIRSMRTAAERNP